MLGSAAMLVCGPLMFLDVLPDLPRYGIVLVYSFLSGLVPAGVLGAVPYFSPTPAQIGTTNGLIIQGSHLGQFLGPPRARARGLVHRRLAGRGLGIRACGIGAMAFAAAIWRARMARSAPASR